MLPSISLGSRDGSVTSELGQIPGVTSLGPKGVLFTAFRNAERVVVRVMGKSLGVDGNMINVDNIGNLELSGYVRGLFDNERVDEVTVYTHDPKSDGPVTAREVTTLLVPTNSMYEAEVAVHETAMREKLLASLAAKQPS